MQWLQAPPTINTETWFGILVIDEGWHPEDGQFHINLISASFNMSFCTWLFLCVEREEDFTIVFALELILPQNERTLW